MQIFDSIKFPLQLMVVLKAFCHISYWPQQSESQHNGFLCQSVYLKQRRANHLDSVRPQKVRGLAAIQNFYSLYCPNHPIKCVTDCL